MSDTPPGLVAVPAVPWMFTRAAESFARLAVNLPDGSELRFLRGGTTIAVKRKRAVKRALTSDADWLLQVDSDMVPPPDVAERLWSTLEETGAEAASAVTTSSRRGTNIIAGVAPRERPAGQVTPKFDRPCPHCIDERDGAVEARMVGAACLMVRTEVFRQLSPPWFPDDEEGVREDVGFCRRLREEGMKVVVDTDLDVGHLGVHPFGLGDAVREHVIRKEHPDLAGR